MTKMTPKMQAFVDNMAAGLQQRDAGLAAGYAHSTVDQAVSRLMKRPDIKKAIKKAKTAVATAVDEQHDDALLDEYEDSKHFFRHAMNNPRLPRGMRFEAAKQLLPYEHARVAEKGKKESKMDRAKEAAGGKFKSKQPPKLTLVGGKK